MKITANLIEKIHKIANEKLYRDYPLLDMANRPEGHIKRYEVRYVLEAYNKVKQVKEVA